MLKWRTRLAASVASRGTMTAGAAPSALIEEIQSAPVWVVSAPAPPATILLVGSPGLVYLSSMRAWP
ncbi:hypothetical protein ACFQU9_13085 [Actinomadura namibiensis]|uniref:hypothetical protein n=1 Tax=Actinomadura kijaniata TaxID=46161 RepID=UPI00360EDD65